MRRATRDDIFVGDLGDLASLRLRGSHCTVCGEVSLGAKDACPNCGAVHLGELALSTTGTVWSHTTVRHRPPGGYLGPDPFEPFVLALVEVPEGVRVMTRVDGPAEDVTIGTMVSLSPSIWTTSDGDEIVGLAFATPEVGRV